MNMVRGQLVAGNTSTLLCGYTPKPLEICRGMSYWRSAGALHNDASKRSHKLLD